MSDLKSCKNLACNFLRWVFVNFGECIFGWATLRLGLAVAAEVISELTALPSPIYLLLDRVQFKLQFLLPLPNLDGLATDRDGQPLIFTLELNSN